MSVTLKPTSEIKLRLGLEENGHIQSYFTERCKDHMDKYVPFDKGNLATQIDTQPDRIVYQQKYAKYQYYGQRKDGTHVIKNRSLDKHDQATSYWDKKMVSIEMKDIIKEVEEEIKRGGK